MLRCERLLLLSSVCWLGVGTIDLGWVVMPLVPSSLSREVGKGEESEHRAVLFRRGVTGVVGSCWSTMGRSSLRSHSGYCRELLVISELHVAGGHLRKAPLAISSVGVNIEVSGVAWRGA